MEYDEENYLQRYPDVRRAIIEKIIPTGLHHYEKYGRKEGRLPFAPLLWRQQPSDLDFLSNNKSEGPLNIKTFADLNKLCLSSIAHIEPETISAFVGIPRSGLLVANMLALHTNKDLITLNDFINGARATQTTRRPSRPVNSRIGKKRVVVVDDSVATGGTLSSAKREIAAAGLESIYDIKYLAAFTSKVGTSIVDYYFKIVENPRIFEWNLIHHVHTQHFCFDMDGVLCEDPTPYENDGGERYSRFVAQAKAKAIPSMLIGAVVTARLEKHRAGTEAWLSANNVRYRRLIMLDIETEAERSRLQAHAKVKASVYSTTNAMLFIESDPGQANEIARISGKQVYCFGDAKVYTRK